MLSSNLLYYLAAYGVMTLAQGKGWVKKSKKSKVAAGELIHSFLSSLIRLII